MAKRDIFILFCVKVLVQLLVVVKFISKSFGIILFSLDILYFPATITISLT